MNRRLILSALAFVFLGPAMAARADSKPVVLVTKVKVNNLVPVGDHLVANATVTLKIAGRDVKQDVQIPLSLTGSVVPTVGAAPAATTNILHLSLGPINLDLLGLAVILDNCQGGPVTVDITAVTGPGNLLGNLLSGIAGLLNGGTSLSTILSGLTIPQLGTLESGLTSILNQVLSQTLKADATPAATSPAGTAPILNLQIPNGLHLNLLGLKVDTSAICLNIYAIPSTQAGGGLLGDLLYAVVNLLNNNGSSHAINSLLREIVQILQALGL